MVIVSGSIFYSPELTKFELLTTIVEHNCVDFNQTLRIKCVFILNTVLSARYSTTVYVYILLVAMPPPWA